MLKTPDVAVVARLQQHSPECAVAAPVWHELLYGVQRLPKGKRRAALDDYLENVVHGAFPILAYDQLAARWHADERARLEALGKTAPFVDGQIAAIAAVNGLTVVTTNVRDFTRFKGLTVENWSR